MNNEPEQIQKASLTLSEVVILVIADQCWSRGPTLQLALAQIKRVYGKAPRQYVAYLAHRLPCSYLAHRLNLRKLEIENIEDNETQSKGVIDG